MDCFYVVLSRLEISAPDIYPNAVKRYPGGDEQRFAIGAAEADVGGDFGDGEAADQLAVGRPDDQPAGLRGPEISSLIAANAIRRASIHLPENTRLLERAVILHIEDANVFRPAVVG